MLTIEEIETLLRQSVDCVLQKTSASTLLANHESKIRQWLSSVNVLDRSIQRPGQTDEQVLTIVGVGKMADALVSEFVNRVGVAKVRGVVSAPYDSAFEPVAGIRSFRGGHPIPNNDSIAAAKYAMEMLGSCGPEDPVVYLISGGGSACFELPVEELAIENVQATYHSLVNSGLSIQEVNILRSILSQVKGGKLSSACSSQRQLALIVSDVPRAHLSYVSSGLTSKLSFTKEDVERILSDKRESLKMSEAIEHVLMDYEDREVEPDEPTTCENICIGDNADATAALMEFFGSKDWVTLLATDFDEVPVGDAVERLLRALDEMDAEKCCLIAGGEVISTVIGSGKGGRNQALAMEFVPRIAGKDMAVLCFGTDGIDGNTTAAGGIVTGTTSSRADQLGLEIQNFRSSSNSHEYLRILDSLVDTGPTGINVRDVCVLLKW